jgi:hypothetical protein
MNISKNNLSQSNYLLIVIAILVALIITEILLRLFLPRPIQWKYPQEYRIFDNEIGHWLKANQRSYTHDKLVETNSIGIRDKDYSSYPGPNVVRGLAIGDSQTFGNGLVLSETWPKLLESRMNSQGGSKKWEILNCGLPATDTWQHEIILNRMIQVYHPNIVILAVYINDITVPWTPDPKSALVMSTGISHRIIYLIKKSVVLLVLRDGISAIRQLIYPSYGFLYEKSILTGGNDLGVEKGWNQVDKSLEKMKELCDKNHIILYILLIPRRDQVNGQEKIFVFNNKLQELSSKNNIPLIDTLESLSIGYKKYLENLFIAWDGHNSKFSNEIIANDLSKILIKNIH